MICREEITELLAAITVGAPTSVQSEVMIAVGGMSSSWPITLMYSFNVIFSL